MNLWQSHRLGLQPSHHHILPLELCRRERQVPHRIYLQQLGSMEYQHYPRGQQRHQHHLVGGHQQRTHPAQPLHRVFWQPLYEQRQQHPHPQRHLGRPVHGNVVNILTNWIVGPIQNCVLRIVWDVFGQS